MIIHRNLPTHPEAVGGSETGVPVGPKPTPAPTPAPTPPIPPQYLIDYIAVAEPPSQALPTPGRFLFQMKVNDLSTVPANSRWRMVWNSVSSPDEQYYVGMTTDASSVVTFEYGTILTQSIPPVVGVIGVPTENQVAVGGSHLAGSNFNPDGT